jgi:hypothetical protein
MLFSSLIRNVVSALQMNKDARQLAEQRRSWCVQMNRDVLQLSEQRETQLALFKCIEILFICLSRDAVSAVQMYGDACQLSGQRLDWRSKLRTPEQKQNIHFTCKHTPSCISRVSGLRIHCALEITELSISTDQQ